MKNIFIFISVLLVIFVLGFVVFKYTNFKGLISKVVETKKISPKPLPAIFDKLSQWVPTASWGELQKSTQMTPYGKTVGLKMIGEIKGKNATISRNFEDIKIMNSFGFFEDMNFAADGPGSSNWGYSKTENGKIQVAIFRYSTNRILGPESKAPPFVNLSVFVSEPFKLSD
jgi:hypothetical protein